MKFASLPRIGRTVVIAAAAALMLTACDEGELTLDLTEFDPWTPVQPLVDLAPPADDLTALRVGIREIELETEDGSIRTITFDEPEMIDLVQDRSAQRLRLLDRAVVESDSYRAIRLRFSTDQSLEPFAQRASETNRSELRFVESSARTEVNFRIRDLGAETLAVDFDLRGSLFQTQDDFDNNRVAFRPRIRAVVSDFAGAITGTVGNIINQSNCVPGVYLYEGFGASLGSMGSDDPPMTSRLVDGPGSTFVFDDLPPGEYTVAVTCEADLDNPNDDDVALDFLDDGDVEVFEAEQSVIDF